MKYHPHHSVLFCTFTVEEGLLLLCNPLCEAIIISCLTRAQTLYPIHICHFLVEATHVHMLLVVDDPDNVSHFMRAFKTESAHMINRLLGRRKRTIWCEGYDSPIVLTPLRALIVIVYSYSNPSKDNLETSIDRYPGVSTWRMFLKGEHTKRCKRLRRSQFRALPKDSHNLRGYTKEALRLLKESTETQTLRLEPNKWLEVFGITDPEEQRTVNQRIVDRVYRFEQRAERARLRAKKRVLGRERLTTQRFDLSYRPNRRHGRKMWCLSEKRSVRVAFIRFFKALMQQAREVRRRWGLGDTSVRYPPGLYPPSMPKLAEVLPG